MRVRCIDNRGYGEGYLQEGSIYEVYSGDHTTYKLVGIRLDAHNQPYAWNKDRFEVVREETTSVEDTLQYVRNNIRKAFGIPKSQTGYKDAEEERLRGLLRPRVEPGCCICGISKQLCDYHR